MDRETAGKRDRGAERQRDRETERQRGWPGVVTAARAGTADRTRAPARARCLLIQHAAQREREREREREGEGEGEEEGEGEGERGRERGRDREEERGSTWWWRRLQDHPQVSVLLREYEHHVAVGGHEVIYQVHAVGLSLQGCQRRLQGAGSLRGSTTAAAHTHTVRGTERERH